MLLIMCKALDYCALLFMVSLPVLNTLPLYLITDKGAQKMLSSITTEHSTTPFIMSSTSASYYTEQGPAQVPRPLRHDQQSTTESVRVERQLNDDPVFELEVGDFNQGLGIQSARTIYPPTASMSTTKPSSTTSVSSSTSTVKSEQLHEPIVDGAVPSAARAVIMIGDESGGVLLRSVPTHQFDNSKGRLQSRRAKHGTTNSNERQASESNSQSSEEEGEQEPNQFREGSYKTKCGCDKHQGRGQAATSGPQAVHKTAVTLADEKNSKQKEKRSKKSQSNSEEAIDHETSPSASHERNSSHSNNGTRNMKPKCGHGDRDCGSGEHQTSTTTSTTSSPSQLPPTTTTEAMSTTTGLGTTPSASGVTTDNTQGPTPRSTTPWSSTTTPLPPPTTTAEATTTTTTSTTTTPINLGEVFPEKFVRVLNGMSAGFESNGEFRADSQKGFNVFGLPFGTEQGVQVGGQRGVNWGQQHQYGPVRFGDSYAVDWGDGTSFGGWIGSMVGVADKLRNMG